MGQPYEPEPDIAVSLKLLVEKVGELTEAMVSIAEEIESFNTGVMDYLKEINDSIKDK